MTRPDTAIEADGAQFKRASEPRAVRALVPLGWLCLVAGLLGLASAILLMAVEPSVGRDRFSYPFTSGAFAVIQVWFSVQHIGLLAGLYGLWRSGAVGTSPLGRWGAWGAVLGMGLLTVTELVAISGSDSVRPSARTDVIGSLYGIATILLGAALIVAGIAAIRAGQWRGWRRLIPLILGVYVFVPFIPALFASYVLARLAVGGWMLGFAFLGWVLLSTAREPPPTS
jgi:hypothetical protein